MGIVSLKYDVSFKYLMLNEIVRRYFISDVLELRPEEIRSVRLGQTFLWRRLRRHKGGILDLLAELNNDSKVNIELQVRMMRCWDKRSLFYLAKMFTEDLLTGEDYGKLKRCVCINILDFNLDKGSEYHKAYRLRDDKGNEYSDLFEVHVIELRKELKGTDKLDDWIRLLNAATEEELDMIKTKNPGILEAIKEVKHMSLRKEFRILHEAKLKERRDRKAEDDYVRAEGKAAGKAQAVLLLLEQKGTIPQQVKEAVLTQKEEGTLAEWLLLAAKAKDAEEFCRRAGFFG